MNVKKYFIFILLFNTASFAQSTLQKRLYNTCKVWGFIKYYHSNVSICNVNWDSVLLHVLPAIETASTDSIFNNQLDTLLAAAGPMALATSYFPDTLPANLKFNRDFSWMTSPIFRSEVLTQLDTIKNNFRPHNSCYVENNSYTTTYTGYLLFPHDSMELNISTFTSYPDAEHRLLMFFKYWNILRYFYPYNPVLDINIDSTLSDYVIPIDTVSSSQYLFFLYMKISARLEDVHAYGLTWDGYYNRPPGFHKPLIRLQNIDSQYVVIRSLVSGINLGDILISKNGISTAHWEDSLKQYYSSGNIPVLRRTISEEILDQIGLGSFETVVFKDSTGTNHSFLIPCTSTYSNDNFFYGPVYPNDSLDSIKWTTMPCNVGYVNMGNLQDSNVNQMYFDLKNKPAIIFDLRNYPNSTMPEIVNLLYPSPMEFAKLTLPDVTYPGTYYWEHEILGYTFNPNAYTGKVIILMNEYTQSQAEWSCMGLQAMSGSVKVGSQTAGADGNVTYWYLSNDMQTGMTTLGVYYPNGDSTQRIGIVPDSMVHMTIAGIKHHDDEVLNKALQIACSLNTTGLPLPQKTITIYPNPAENNITIDATCILSENITFEITDIAGKILITKNVNDINQQHRTIIDINSLTNGMYFLNTITESHHITTKFVKH